MIVTRTPLTDAAAFDLAEVKAHARVDGTHDDAALALMADAAAREIEAHSGLALLAQIITVEWDMRGDMLRLPVGPLWLLGTDDNPVTVQTREADGAWLSWPQGWHIDGAGLRLHHRMDGTALRLVYPAGFGLTADSIPADVRLAVMDQAAAYYDRRGAEDGTQGLSLAASRIAARYKRVAA